MIGKTPAHYEITEKLGQGRMGEVFSARDFKSRIQVTGRLDACAAPRENRLDSNQLEMFDGNHWRL